MTKLSVKAFALSGRILAISAAIYSTGAEAFDRQCIMDFRCLRREAVKHRDEVSKEKLTQYVFDLSRLGLFEDANVAARRFNRFKSDENFGWQSAKQEIAVHEIAAKAVAMPDAIASFSPIDALAGNEQDGFSFSDDVYCSLIVDVIIHRSPWSALDSRTYDIFRPSTVRGIPLSTLTYILETRWPGAIDKLPKEKQGWAWNELAEVWIELGHPERARPLVERAEQVGMLDFRGQQIVFNTTWKTWISLGDLDRAMLAASRISDKAVSASLKLKVAEVFIQRKSYQNALSSIADALADIVAEPNSSQRMGELRRVVLLMQSAGDLKGASAVAHDMADLAHKPDILPGAQLTVAASAFNDLADDVSAKFLLSEAIKRIPQNDQKVGVGATLGPITGATLGVAESMRADAAVQLYRVGDDQRFYDLLDQSGAEYRRRVWLELCESHDYKNWRYPAEQDCLVHAGPIILVEYAADAVSKNDLTAAASYLRRAMDAFQGENKIAAIYDFLHIAKVAYAMRNSELVQAALTEAAITADQVKGEGDRAVAIASVAALQYELTQLQ